MKNSFPQAPDSSKAVIALVAALSMVMDTAAFADTNCTLPPSNLVSWWRAEGDAVDSTGTNNGTLINGASFGAGEVGQGFNLNGVNQYVQVPDNDLWAFGTNNFSVELWANITALYGGHNSAVFIDNDEGQGPINKWFFGIVDGLLQFDINGPASGAFNLVWTPFTPTLGQWYHFAVTRSNTTFTIYVNGVAVGSEISNPNIPNANAPLWIGHFETDYFNGRMDEVSIYRRALSVSEIQSIYNAGSAGKLCDIPPSITTQPASKAVTVGADVTFSVVANGSAPLSYQWRVNGTNIVAATDTTLALTNVQLADAGSYSIVVSNAVNSVTSSNAVLTVNPLPPCVNAPSNIIGWWRAEGDANDFVGGNSGTLIGGAGFASGEAGQAFNFDGVNDEVQIPDSDLWAFGSNSFTIELWANFRTVGSTSVQGGVFVSNDEGSGSVKKWFFAAQSGLIHFHINSPTGGSGTTFSFPFAPNLNQWYHCAVTRAGNVFAMYVNGALVGSATNSLAIPNPSAPLRIGRTETSYFNGLLDEVAVYSRALSGSEIQSIYNANISGKCAVLVAPFITAQPTNRTVVVGSNTTFTVTAGGTPPLSYQWSFNGTNLAGATGTSLILTNVQLTQAGNYSVVVSNPASSVTSSNAMLTVNPVVCTSPPSGLVSWWQAENNALDAVSGNNGTLQSGVTFATGKVGQAFNFNGSSTSYVTVPDSATVRFSNALTLECWAKRSNTSQVHVLVEKGGDWTGGQTDFELLLYDNYPGGSQLQFSFASGFRGCAAPLDTGWHHYAAVVPSNGQANPLLYIDGVLQTIISSGGQATINLSASTRALHIGAQVDPFVANYFSATLVDELSLYNRGLSAGEIQSIFNSGSLGKCSSPTPPVIVSQPTNQTVVVGNTATFTVLANGTPPLSYQWSFNGTNLAGATGTSLILTNVQLTQAGNYSVVVSNPASSVTSSNAMLTVNPVVCTSPPSGLVSWWQAESNALDAVSGNNGTLQSGVTFATGKVGQAFNFNGSSTSYVTVPDSATLRFTNALTIECWAKRSNTSQVHVLVEKGGDWTGGQTDFELLLYDNYPGGSQLQFSFASGFRGCAAPLDTGWHHYAAVVPSNGQANPLLYIDGVLQTIISSGGQATINLSASTRALHIGAQVDPNTANYFSATLVDELSLYNRGLSAGEIQSIFNSGFTGKCPIPPSITAQPTNKVVVAGSSATFTVIANGSQPLSYQWRFNGTNIAGANSALLTLTNVQFDQAGSYSVVVTNLGGPVTSSNAVLTVDPPPPCVNAPSNLVSLWRAEGDASDSAGTNNGTPINGATFSSGEVGQAFAFNGDNQYVQVPDNDLWAFGTNNFSIELWANITALYGSHRSATFINNDEGQGPINKWFFGIVDGLLQFDINGPASGAFNLVWTPFTPTLGQWYHFAITRSNTTFTIYVNGVAVGSEISNPNIPNANAPLWIGHFETDYFNGRMDEVSIYKRALSVSEIQSIYNAGSAGKCAVPIAPYIISQPTNRTVVVGSNTSFTVVAGGTKPLTYQWNFNGTNIAGATNSSLTLTNVQPTNAGSYAASVSNAFDGVVSSGALLTVVFPPAVVRVVSANAAAGSTVVVPVVLVANGNENALGFSLNFATSRLTYTGVSLGGGIGVATMFVNDSGTSTGRLGVALSLAAGNTFPAGTQEVANVTFTTAVVTSNTVTAISFADAPIVRQLSDAAGHALSASYATGTVSIAAVEYEGDVSPRPAGDRVLTITDWVLAGRYAARLDYPTNASEFQRADCAPRDTLGNGAITVSDWVQAGRYAAGLDPATPVGGPTTEALSGSAAPKRLGPTSGEDGDTATRQLRVVDAALAQNQSGIVCVNLEAMGDENALGFSLAFDPAVFSFVGAILGNAATGATLNVNTDQVSSGGLGFVLALPAGTNFTAGTRELVKVSLRAAAGPVNGYPVSFSSQPVPREVSDKAAHTLTADYVNGVVFVNPPPTLNIARAGQNIALSWPLWASNFVLQTADGVPASGTWTNAGVVPAVSNSENVVTLSIPGAAKYFRLSSP